jgi:hypothetical protein
MNDVVVILDSCFRDAIQSDCFLAVGQHLKDTRKNVFEETGARIAELNRSVAEVAKFHRELKSETRDLDAESGVDVVEVSD